MRRLTLLKHVIATAVAAVVVGLVPASPSLPRSIAVAHAAETDDLFAGGLRALAEGRPADAIAAFEALADRGEVDAVASFDRALSYAERVRIGAGQPGDLGQAAHGFEEARELSTDASLEAAAARGLIVVRGEVARRKAHAGEPVELDRGDSLGRSIVRTAPEDAWTIGALVASVLLGAALFARGLSTARRVRIGGAIVAALAAPSLVVLGALTMAAREERRVVREGVVIAPSARLADERGIALAAGGTVPEGARVRVLETRGTLARVRWGATEAWVQSSAVRPMQRRD